MFSSALIRWSVLLAVAASLLSCERKPELFADQIIWIERATMEGSVWMTPGLECLKLPSANAVRVDVGSLDRATSIARELEIERHNRTVSREMVVKTCQR
jgi:hypothetical protein